MAHRSHIRVWVAGVASFFRDGLIVAVNTLGLFVAANVGAALYLSREQPVVSSEAVRREKAAAVVAKYGIDFFKRLYPDKTEAQVRELLYDQPEQPSVYEPFAEFRSSAMTRATLTIHQAGFRLNGVSQGPWPLDSKALNIFVFGGSTTLGSKVEDEKTIPAVLQSILREKVGNSGIALNVYNFGVGGFFSSQEVTYFQNQLRYGNLPDMVVFIDGLNDFHFWDGDPATAKSYRHIYYLLWSLNRQIGREQGVAWHLVELWQSLPIVQLAKKIGGKPDKLVVRQPGTGWISRANAAPTQPSHPKDAPDQRGRRSDLALVAGAASADELYSGRYSDGLQITDPVRIQAVIARYLTNKDIAQAIANQFGIEAVFVWQPAPLYRYNLAMHPYKIEDEHRRMRYGYPAMAHYVEARDMGANFAWCADVLGNFDHPLYLDQVHYTAEANRLIADCIARAAVASGAIDRIRQRKFGQIAAVAARQDFSVTVEAVPIATSAIGTVFGPEALTENMTMSGPLSEWGDLASSGVELADDSAGYSVIYQYFPLERVPAERTHQVSVRIKPASSDYLGLVMVCLGGANPENVAMFVNPQTMGVISASGHHDVRHEPEGWTRLTLSGTCEDPGHDRLQVMLYPAHGAPENRGAIIFGGGELRRVVGASPRLSDQGPRP